MRRVVSATLLALLCACGSSTDIPPGELRITVSAEVGEVELGKAFSLTVVRSWSKELSPEPFGEKALEPLRVRLKEKTRREEADRVQETLLYDAYAFSLEPAVRVPAPVIEARPAGGGEVRRAEGEPLELSLTRALAPGARGPAELPPGPLGPRGLSVMAWAALIVFAAAGSAASVALWMRRRRGRKGAPAGAELPAVAQPSDPPHVKALQRLEQLRRLRPASREETEAFYVEASALMRDFLEERFALRARDRTTEEIVNAPRTAEAVPAPQRPLVADYLVRCDLSKFAAVAWPEPARLELLDSGERFLVATAPQHAENAPAAPPPAGGPPAPSGGDAP